MIFTDVFIIVLYYIEYDSLNVDVDHKVMVYNINIYFNDKFYLNLLF